MPSANVIFEVNGIEDINKALMRMPERLRNEVAPKALLEASKIMVEEATMQAPLGPNRDVFGRWRRRGKLKGSIKAKLESVGYWKSFEVTIAPRGKAAHYAHLVEMGHRVVIYGEDRGAAKPNAFMQRSFEAKGHAVNERAMGILMDGCIDVMTAKQKRANVMLNNKK